MRLRALKTLEVELQLAYARGDEYRNIYVVIRPAKNVLVDENQPEQVGAITCAHGVHNQDVDEGVGAEDHSRQPMQVVRAPYYVLVETRPALAQNHDEDHGEDQIRSDGERERRGVQPLWCQYE